MFKEFKKGSGGHYEWCEEEKKFIRVSDKPDKLPYHGLNGNTYFPEGGSGYFDKGLRRYFNTKTEKINFMKANNLVNEGSFEKDSTRVKNLCNIINSERVKIGEKPKMESELIGNSRNT